jgi:hypothetical protein
VLLNAGIEFYYLISALLSMLAFFLPSFEGNLLHAGLRVLFKEVTTQLNIFGLRRYYDG